MAAIPNTPDRVLLLIPSNSYRVDDFMAAAERLGIEVAVGSEQRQVLEQVSGGGSVTVDFADPAAGAAQVARHAARHPVRAIIGVDERTTLVAAMAADAVGLPHNDVDAVRAAGDKHLLRRALARAGLGAPGFRLVSRQADPDTECGAISFPCVLKPLSLSGSRGVIRADDEAEFVAAFRRLDAILDAADPAARNILVEDYIPGTELAAEGLLVEGRYQSLALFDKPDALDGPFFEETLYVTPSRLPKVEQDLITRQVAAGAAALGLRHGPVHAEIRLNQDGPWIIELAARSIGGLCSRSLRFGAGLRLEELILMHATGRALGDPAPEKGASGVMMIPIPSGGILRHNDGVQAALAEPGIEDVRITIPVGQRVVPLPEGDRYLGFIFARGETAAEVEAVLRSAHARLSFAIEPVPAAVDA